MTLPPPSPASSREGRSLGWRAGMAFAGVLLAGAAVALWLWPWLLTWAIAAALALGAVFFLASAVLAKGRRAP